MPSVTNRLTIITEIISPYRIPLFNALNRHPNVDLHLIFLAETDPELRQWQVYKNEIDFSYEVLPSYRKRIRGHNALLNRGVARALSVAKPDAILCGGYNYLASWQALRWARKRGVPFLLWSESNLQDMRAGSRFIEFLKREFLRRCSGFVVPGRSALEYLRAHGIKESDIFKAVNAVDNDRFSRAAAVAQENAVQLRSELSLPTRYFLFVGRLVREKGIFELLAAYASLEEDLRADVGLVFVGDGPSRSCLGGRSSFRRSRSDKICWFRPSRTVARVLHAGGNAGFAYLHRHLGTSGQRSDGLWFAGHPERSGRMRRRFTDAGLEWADHSNQECRRSCFSHARSCKSARSLCCDGFE